jgi:O-antigen/teichoic acid export membrane protein
VLAVSLVVLYVNSAICWALVSLDKERALFPLFTAAAVGNILLNLVLIPTFQHTGAALATLASEVVIGMIAATMLPKWLVSARPFVLAGKAALSAAGMALALMVVQDRLPILLLIPAGGLVYAVLLVVLKAVPYEDIAMLRRAIMPVRRKASVGESHAV